MWRAGQRAQGQGNLPRQGPRAGVELAERGQSRDQPAEGVREEAQVLPGVQTWVSSRQAALGHWEGSREEAGEEAWG